MVQSREQRKGVKRGRMLNYSGSTSNLHSSLEPERSTPSYNYASSRCPDYMTTQDHSLGECVELNVTILWLDTADNQRYLLLEDTETGDILMPLTRMKELLGDNYSRLLNNADNRFVIRDPNTELGPHNPARNLYWLWPFESPSNVKSLIRRELQDQSTGHIRLVLLPVVYNALSKILKDSQAKKQTDHRVTPGLLALERALSATLRNSTYAQLVHLPKHDADHADDRNCESTPELTDLFRGPLSVHLTAEKYMSPHNVSSRKKAKMGASQRAVITNPQHCLRGVAELNTEMQQVHERIDWQAKRIDELEGTLEETKTFFATIVQAITSDDQPSTDLSQLVPAALPTEQQWNALTPQSGQMAQNTARHTDASLELLLKSGFVRFNHGACEVPPHEPMMTSGPQQSLMVGGSSSGSSHNRSQTPWCPTVASKAHHLAFSSPQTPNMQSSSISDSMFSGHVRRNSSESAGMPDERGINSPAYVDYVRRPPSFNRVEPRPLNMPPMH